MSDVISVLIDIVDAVLFILGLAIGYTFVCNYVPKKSKPKEKKETGETRDYKSEKQLSLFEDCYCPGLSRKQYICDLYDLASRKGILNDKLIDLLKDGSTRIYVTRSVLNPTRFPHIRLERGEKTYLLSEHGLIDLDIVRK